MRPYAMRLGLVLVALVGAIPSGIAQTADSSKSTGIRVTVDSRVELISIVFHLAGSPEYCQGRVPSYSADVESQFGRFRNHAVVRRAQMLRGTHGVSFDAPMSLAVYLTDSETLRLRGSADPLPPGVDSRWTPADVKAFLADLRTFARDSHFATFVKAHQPLYQLAISRMSQAIQRNRVKEWFDEFFGARPGAQYTIALGMLNGGSCYGPSCRLPDGREELYSVLGVWATDSAGKPAFSQEVIPTVVHEFCHSYSNPLVNRHLKELQAPAERILPHVLNQMRQQGYGPWETMMYESLVRACVVRYVLARGGPAAAAQEVKGNEAAGFLWLGQLADLLGEYEKRRSDYPTLDAFMPRVAAFFTDYAGRIDSVMAERAAAKKRQTEELRAKGPKVVSTVPADGDGSVDPALKAIVITFDRPMLTGNMAVIRLGDVEFPPAGKAAFDGTGKVLTMPVHLKPGSAYGFGLNGEGFLVMRDTQGNPLAPVEIRFKTK